MPAQGTATRETPELKVRVWGMGCNEQPFFQNAVAQNISSTGACLHGLETELKVGDVIGVQFESRKARCKVVWVTDAGTLPQKQIAVELVRDQVCPWIEKVPVEGHGEEWAAKGPSNRRRFARHRISYPLELRAEKLPAPLRVNVTDISGGGCYVESVMPLPVGTPLQIDLWIGEERVSPNAVVRTRDPGVGMGIEFIGLPEDVRKRLQAHLDEVDSGSLRFKSGR
jgi:hypothetical protein